jgi:hypothetical protein
MLTLEELLRSVLLVECIVDNRSLKVVDHGVDRRCDLFLTVPRVVHENGILRLC